MSKHVLARIGVGRLRDLKPSDLRVLLTDLLNEGYATSTVARVRTHLGQVLAYAQAEGLVAQNVAAMAPNITLDHAPGIALRRRGEPTPRRHGEGHDGCVRSADAAAGAAAR
jgi:hypothetical protein